MSGSSVAFAFGRVKVGGVHDDAVAAGVADQGVRAPEPHRLGIQERGAERRRLVVLIHDGAYTR